MAKQPPSIENKPANQALDITIPQVQTPVTQESIIRQQQGITQQTGQKRSDAETGIETSLQGLEGAMAGTQGQNRALAQAGVTGVLPPELQAVLGQTSGRAGQLQAQLDALAETQGKEQIGLAQETAEAGLFRPQAGAQQAGLRQIQALEASTLANQFATAQQQEQAVAEQNLNMINAYYDAIDKQEEREIAFQKELLDTNKDLFKFYGGQEFQQFQNELDSQQKAVDQRVKDRNDVNELKKTILERNPNAPAAVLEAQTIDELFAVPNIGKFIQDPNTRMDLAVKKAQLDKLREETRILTQPEEFGVTARVSKKLQDLGSTDREAFQNARSTSTQIARMQEIIGNQTDIGQFLRIGSRDAREFERLALDVADKMARERTGAVVNPEEIDTFKTILGVGFGNTIRSTDDEIISTLDKFKNIHNETVDLIDPTGEITDFLNDKSKERGVVQSPQYNASPETKSFVQQTMTNLYGGDSVDNFTRTLLGQ